VDLFTALDHARPDRVVRNLTVVRYDLPDGCCGAYYPETQPLIALEDYDPQSFTPAYKSVPVHIRRADGIAPAGLAITREGVVGAAVAVD
jgi:hypothetical protein